MQLPQASTAPAPFTQGKETQAMSHDTPALSFDAATRPELSVLAAKSLLVAFRHRKGQAALVAALQGLPVSADYLDDRRNWLSFDLLVQLIERLVVGSDDPGFARHAGQITASEETLGLTYHVMRGVGTPRFLYRHLFANLHLYNRVGRLTLQEISDTHVVVTYTPLRPEWNDTPLIAEFRLAQFESMTMVFGLPPAVSQVTRLPQADDTVAFRYRLDWLPRPDGEWRDWRLWAATLAAVGVYGLGRDWFAAQGPRPGFLLPVVVASVGWIALRAKRSVQEGSGLVRLLESTLEEARDRHDELRSANLMLEHLKRQLEHKVEAQDLELKQRYDELQQTYARVQELSTRDGLTGLLNRRSGDEALNQRWAECRAAGLPLSVLLFDLDYFKSVNDQHGHAGGDMVLHAVGHAMLAQSDPSLVVARYGGEEFLAVLPGYTLKEALAWGERLAETLRQTHPLATAPDYVIRLSGGVVEMGREAHEPHTLVRAADELLYAAKKRGRDRIVHQARDPSRGGTPPWSG
jgi:diguanylate cyclase (GGDEF)-like protein